VLPYYMIPAAFVFLETLPLTPNRKVDRKALPEPGPPAGDLHGLYEPPSGKTEERLAAILASLLNVPRVGRKDSFFDLGGHSLVAATLFLEIEHVFGKRLPLATLYHSSTIEHLAAEVENQPKQIDEWPSLVPVQPHGTKARFFSIHGAGGNVLLYRDLARHFGGDYAFYGLQSQGLDGKGSPLTTVEAMAEKYLSEIRRLQPEGPYFLGGYCLGGTIAYEMAQRLRRDGQEVALLALMDTYNFARMERRNPFGYLCQKVAFHCNNLANLPLENWPGYLSDKLGVARSGEFASLLKALTKSLKKSRNSCAPSVDRSVQEANDRAAEAYRPTPYAGRVTLFKTKVNYDFYPDTQMGWGDLVTGGLETVELPVNPHAMLIEPFVQTLAGRLKEAVGRACPAGCARMSNAAASILFSKPFFSVLNFIEMPGL
jgi:thioesterase domain-containing protein/acyl carrier protein